MNEFVFATFHVTAGSTSYGEICKGMPKMFELLWTYKGLGAVGDANKYAHFHSAAHQESTERNYGYGMGDTKNGGVAVLARAFISAFNSNADFFARVNHRFLSSSPLSKTAAEGAQKDLDCMCTVIFEWPDSEITWQRRMAKREEVIDVCRGYDNLL